MKLLTLILSIVSFCSFSSDEPLSKLLSTYSKTEFLSFKSNVDWIKSRPVIRDQEKDERTLGNGKYSYREDYDCDLDRKIDMPIKYAAICDKIKKYYETN